MRGIDISSHQGRIDWGKVKVDFAIIRLGYGDNIERQDDTEFFNNVKGCIDNGIPFGVYIYSYAKNLTGSESVQSEIDHTLRLLRQLPQKPFCVYYDMEDKSTEYLKKLMLTNFALEYCKQIKNAGYNVGVYANENWFKNFLNCSTIASYGYSIWVAKYSEYKPNITSCYDIWQYSDKGSVDGINGVVDMNIMERDIRGASVINNAPNSSKIVNNKVNAFYKVKTQKHGWLTEVKNLEDYAGYENSPITGIAIKVDQGSIKYRVHLKGKKWLPYVTGYNVNDTNNGYAGNGKDIIDAVEVYYNTPDNIRPYKKAKYKVNNYSWQYDNEKKNGADGYAGAMGVNATKFQMEIE